MKASDTVNPYYLKDREGVYCNKYPEFQVWEEGRKASIKEVVRWGEEDCPHDIQELAESGLCTYKREKPEKKRECPLCWQSKLKEWGANGT